MSRQDDVLRLMESLHIATPVHVARCLKNPTHSGRVQAQRDLNKLVELNLLERRDKFYLIPGCKSEGGEHALAVSDVISELHFRFESQVFREKFVEQKAVRPDVLALIRKDGNALCLIIEVVREESPEYLQMKRSVWEEWTEACAYLSKLFQMTIPCFNFITSDELNWEELCAP